MTPGARAVLRLPVVPLLLAGVMLLLSACTREGPPRGRPVVFAAASLADVLPEACGAELPHPEFAFGASSDLARQVLAGAPADLVVLAGDEPMAALVRGGRVAPSSVVRVAGNELVVIARRGAAFRVDSLADLAARSSVALADPEAVPAGVHARRWLEHDGSWEAVAPVVVPALDVRAALAAVVAGGAEAGIVYATDAATSSDVQILLRAPRGAADVAYLAAPVTGPGEGAGLAVLALITTEAGRAAFRRRGFLVDGAP